ncbi:hypothetical protein M2272_000661 [Mycobacterium frederiksbergense]|uniref:Redoxin domain-containing protein n=1 Tax=Mycolicibacterium frederiksbergense TaxID=117567 RepID=A0ABT6KTJ1_9MYCO|nr:hypothetical protein [Mycolicibacterium frederiksbergense]
MLTVELAQFGLAVSAHFAHDLFAPGEHGVGEHVPWMFRDENPMRVQVVNDVSSGAYVLVWFPAW